MLASGIYLTVLDGYGFAKSHKSHQASRKGTRESRSSLSWYVTTNVFKLKRNNQNQTVPKYQHRLYKYEGKNTNTESIFARLSLCQCFCPMITVLTVLFFFCLMPIKFRGKLIWELNLIYLALYSWNSSGDQMHKQHHADKWGAWAGLNGVIGWGKQMTVRKYVRLLSEVPQRKTSSGAESKIK